jgi:hypothetical protein
MATFLAVVGKVLVGMLVVFTLSACLLMWPRERGD